MSRRHPHYHRHEHTRRSRGPIYRSRNGLVFGVCRGLANHLGMTPGAVRFLTVVAAFFSGGWPVIIAYIVAALVMKPEPILPIESDEDAEFYGSYTQSRTMALSRLKRTYDNLDRRIRRIEDQVTSRGYDWDRRLNDGV